MDKNKRIVGAVLVFALASILWVLISERLLFLLVSDLNIIPGIRTLKGVGFVVVVSIALYFLLLRLEKAERKARYTETATRLLMEKVPQFFTSIPVIAYVLEITNDNPVPIWTSENAIEILGYSMDEILAPGWWVNNIHPDDRLRVLIESKNILNRGSGNHEYRFRLADGSYANIYDELQKVVGDGSSPKRFIGIWNDVSKEYKAQQAIEDYAARLENTILGTVTSVAKIVELRDPYTAGHEERVGDLAASIAREMGLDANVQYGLRIAGLVHDIGKISIPSEFLTKPTKLTPSEYGVIKSHSENGYQILKSVEFPWPVAEVAYQHHERMNGSGYPRGLRGEEILLEARIIAIADVIESMATTRPYRHSLGIDVALDELEQNAGILYDAQVVEVCLRLFRGKGYELPEEVVYQVAEQV